MNTTNKYSISIARNPEILNLIV